MYNAGIEKILILKSTPNNTVLLSIMTLQTVKFILIFDIPCMQKLLLRHLHADEILKVHIR